MERGVGEESDWLFQTRSWKHNAKRRNLLTYLQMSSDKQVRGGDNWQETTLCLAQPSISSLTPLYNGKVYYSVLTLSYLTLGRGEQPYADCSALRLYWQLYTNKIYLLYLVSNEAYWNLTEGW